MNMVKSLNRILIRGKMRSEAIEKVKENAPDYPWVLAGHFEADFDISVFEGKVMEIDSFILNSKEDEAITNVYGTFIWITKEKEG